MTKFIERIFSAMRNQETQVLDQVANDVMEAKEKGSLTADQYDMSRLDDGKVLIKDKINNESTVAEESGKGISLEPYDSRVHSSKERFYLIDSNGMVRAMNQEILLRPILKENPDWKLVSQNELNSMVEDRKFSAKGEQKVFTKFYMTYAVSDGDGNFLGFFEKHDAIRMVQDHPEYSMVTALEYNEKNLGNPTDYKSKFRIINR